MRVAPSLKGVLRVAYARFEGLGGQAEGLPGLWSERRERLAEAFEREDAALRAALRRNRRLYGALGLDPSRDRPEPERLLRLAVRGRIGVPERPAPGTGSSFLDFVLLAALSGQCILEAYDLDRVAPPVLARLGKASRPEDEPARGSFGRLVLADRKGVFGAVGRRLGRARLGPGSKRALVVAWLSPDHPRAELDRAFRDLAALAAGGLGARASSEVLPEGVVSA